ncbi:MAG: M3 family oligoendopeptidase [Cyanophyceae cyanobacterium]
MSNLPSAPTLVSADSQPWPVLPQTWNNTEFYSSSADPQIAVTVEELKGAIADLAAQCTHFSLHIATAATLAPEQFDTLLQQVKTAHQQRVAIFNRLLTLRTFIGSVLSVDAQDTHGREWNPTIQQLFAEVFQAAKPMEMFLLRVNDDFINVLIRDPLLEELRFPVLHERQLQDQLLSLEEEQLVAGLAVSGLHGWGNLYSELAGTLQCQVNGESMGLATASNLQGSSDRALRSAAWHGIRAAWDSQAGTVAAILNAIHGWRLQESQKRGKIRPLHYLDKSCHQHCLDRATLDVLMETTYQRRSIGQRALKTMARVLQVDAMQPWDLFAPLPTPGETTLLSFEGAIALIANAFRRLTPAMGDFAVMMAEKGWIDAKPTPHRATGAYCGRFFDPCQPRIFMTFDGTMGSILILAHELGHAWHAWVTRDLPLYQTDYPGTLGETASIFAETLVREALFAQASTPAEQLAVAWGDGGTAAGLLLNTPARFTFETALVERRKRGFVIPETLKTMMRDSWQHWYEDSLASYDELFWASKQHFSASEADKSFYNYPYLFGYLFSLGIYAQKDRYGEAFNDLYTNLLRDTGRMTAEELVQTHLNQDIRQPEFWQASLDIVDRSVSRFEALAA